ncbi:DUF4190 domain-containing protein [Leucobacter insecticola]|uniref:DUF4190 domain-containing protein n=1 Tax=Leucobacter insecticola TaxID=2714934 RepID=A0A6G8FIC0_9MICO|nr:DUF4190 domain-containing protein [Leucobacter insecticola]QIM16115.1 DUF4190 domain-containing protein [Leucobacter insecticola]
MEITPDRISERRVNVYAQPPQQPVPPQYPAPQTPAPQQAAPQQSFPGQQAPQAYPQQAAQYPQPNHPAPSTATTLDKTNTFALLSIILAFIAPLAGIVFGHMGLSQIKKKGDAGRGIALTGLIISYAYFVFVAVFFFVWIGFVVTLFSSLGGLMNGYSDYGYYN